MLDLSIVIPTIGRQGRPANLGRLLESIKDEKLGGARIEVVIVENGTNSSELRTDSMAKPI